MNAQSQSIEAHPVQRIRRGRVVFEIATSEQTGTRQESPVCYPYAPHLVQDSECPACLPMTAARLVQDSEFPICIPGPLRMVQDSEFPVCIASTLRLTRDNESPICYAAPTPCLHHGDGPSVSATE